jgi:hypothetical protein
MERAGQPADDAIIAELSGSLNDAAAIIYDKCGGPLPADTQAKAVDSSDPREWCWTTRGVVEYVDDEKRLKPDCVWAADNRCPVMAGKVILRYQGNAPVHAESTNPPRPTISQNPELGEPYV